VQEIRRTMGNAEAEAAVRRATDAKTRFDSTHPDARDIIRDPSFRQWVQASPIRMKMLLAADRNYNFEAGDELFGTWKALKKVNTPAEAQAAEQQPAATGGAQPTADEVKQAAATMARARAAKQAQSSASTAAAVPTGGSAGGRAATGGKKIYRRADLIELQIQNPERYEAMQDEITAAYRENRVR
jgi:hypothetical protein